ncbi:hypothetical protein MKW98_026997 [Papaver atlanticum]|uniref:GDSL esterase/lipase n=1 Tax=Papaver atlanticum TaxID=357466 RepID=A0AAD4XS45_9MAGN|nr:hypothetical protein MKW98_001509 [Papaver atlanticum]KAI3962041.1 hypothetical protein MKW98_026997 [Papaver atlanticum]
MDNTQKKSNFISSVLVLFFFLCFFLSDPALAEDSTFSLIDQVVVQNHNSHGRTLSKLFVFGDSYVDTGNNKIFTVESWKYPYGMTLPGIPTGRYSDGLVFTDFLASYMGMKSPMPYKQWTGLFKWRVRNGMNFAHGGTGVFNTWIKEPNMTTQINTFKKYIADGVYNKRDLARSMAIVALSGNDYTQYVLDGGTDEGFRAFIVKVLNQLEVNLREIGKIGLKKVVMLTLQPLGCLPNKAISLSYEKCDEPLNNETIFHNTLLQQIVQKLNSETTDTLFHVLDLYSAFLSVINKSAGETGSTKFGNPLLKPCCIPASAEVLCGSVDGNGVKQYTLCENPTGNIFWDPVHPTQSGWSAISSALKPSIDKLMLCNQLNIHTQRPSSASVATS